ncbi:MAG: ABC transporter ATP-binding protein [Candidatus Cryosericum sp.]
MLRVDKIVSGYGPIDVLNHVSIGLDEGEIVAVLGANGAGKTTLLRTITGLIHVRKGSVTFGDELLNGLTPAEIVRKGIAHVPEGRHIFPDLSVEQNLLLGAYSMPRAGQKSRLEAMYAMFGILAERRTQAGGTLSGGEQQMLALARGLMSNPRLILLDEPSLGLAPKIISSVFETLAQLRSSGVSILLVEQNAKRSLELADRAYILVTGQVALEGTAQELSGNELVQQLYLGGTR